MNQWTLFLKGQTESRARAPGTVCR